MPYRPGGRAWFGPAGGSWRRFTGAPADGEARAHVRCRVANWGHVIKPAAPALYAYFYFCTSCSGTWRPDKTSNVPDDEGRPPPCCELASILSGSSRQNQTVVTIGKKKFGRMPCAKPSTRRHCIHVRPKTEAASREETTWMAEWRSVCLQSPGRQLADGLIGLAVGIWGVQIDDTWCSTK